MRSWSKITTSEILEILFSGLPLGVTYRKIMYAEYQVCNKIHLIFYGSRVYDFPYIPRTQCIYNCYLLHTNFVHDFAVNYACARAV